MTEKSCQLRQGPAAAGTNEATAVKVLSVFGTRPEAIKMAPVIKELGRHPGEIVSRVCVTGQHREMLDQVLRLFQIVPDYDLDLMEPNQSLSQLTARVFESLDPVVTSEQPDWVLVQGDTTTVMAASLVAFYHHVKVGHVEAGLRTSDKWQPFPEEINRRIAGVVAVAGVPRTSDSSRGHRGSPIDASSLLTGFATPRME